ncbi:hypothetical protein PVL29_002421 [Vitis rotundifolia]|uniref:Uncharacterized protein n=1 Tax=Vitis rotundifolia TaxID=103349 RepID=A0AA39E2R4_VITRO|nr:hypothetical protein PVL29_002421 [Vitis rotundifolia]
MPKLMLVVSAELKNIVILQPEDGSDDEKINYYFKLECEHCGWVCENEAYVSINVKEKPTGNRRNDNLNLSRNMGNMICHGCESHGKISLILGHGAPLSQNHCTEVDLMLFNCDGLLHVEYSFNGGWLAITIHFYKHNFYHFYPHVTSGFSIFFFQTFGQVIHIDFVGREYRNVIDGEEVTITNLEAKFVPKG